MNNYYKIGIFGLLFILTSNLILFSVDPVYAVNLVREDGLIESLEAIFYLLSAILILYLFYKSKTDGHYYFLNTRRNYFYLLLGIFFILCFGEEISWGQRIFSFGTPEFFNANNSQKETNIHNLFIWETVNSQGEVSGIGHYLSYAALYIYFWFIYCFLIPVLSKYLSIVQNIVMKISLPLIPVSVGTMFLLSYVYLKFIEKLNISQYRIIGELQEFNSSFLFLIATVALYLAFREIMLKQVPDKT